METPPDSIQLALDEFTARFKEAFYTDASIRYDFIAGAYVLVATQVLSTTRDISPGWADKEPKYKLSNSKMFNAMAIVSESGVAKMRSNAYNLTAGIIKSSPEAMFNARFANSMTEPKLLETYLAMFDTPFARCRYSACFLRINGKIVFRVRFPLAITEKGTVHYFNYVANANDDGGDANERPSKRARA